MSEIGRLNFSRGLRQLLELAGEYEPELLDVAVPVVQVANLASTPFGLDIDFVQDSSVAGIAAQHSYIVLVPNALPVNSWITVHKIVASFPSAGGLFILPYDIAAVPGGLTSSGNVTSMKQSEGSANRRRHNEAAVQSGTSATAPAGNGTLIRGVVGTSVILDGNWSINVNGSLVVASAGTLQGIEVSFFGKIHHTSSR